MACSAPAHGKAWDVGRLARFTELAERLADATLHPDPAQLPVLNVAMVREQPFFEAYLSNFIEGTEFTVDEAVHIVYDRVVPPARPADGHDVLSTYELVSDQVTGFHVATSGADLLEQLRRQHTRLMASRPDKRPGQCKDEENQVGSYHFVAPSLVAGTLSRGLARSEQRSCGHEAPSM